MDWDGRGLRLASKHQSTGAAPQRRRRYPWIATRPAIESKSINAVEGSGTAATRAISPESVIVPVADLATAAELPIQVKVSVPVNDPTSPRIPDAPTFSVSSEFWLKADWPSKKKPVRNGKRLPVKTLPAPLLLPDGTVNPKVSLFRLSREEIRAQPAPVQAAEAVRKPVPVSLPAEVTPLSKLPPDKEIVT